MASNVVAAGAADDDGPDDDRPKVPAPRPSPTGRRADSFFTIYKKGQGKWTRLGTVFAAGLLGLLTAYAIYQNAVAYLPAYDPARPQDHAAEHGREAIGVGVALFVAAFGLLVFWVGNKPRNVDFLIATDSEMKKVNWTTKGELLGSTRIVVLFLVFIALFLLAVDLTFNWFFHLIRVLQT